jgi:hypothetical protein|tara:strand:+ start:30911 stop:31516 length:606 start_codon:yes stop_codon:yes gene_type:complete
MADTPRLWLLTAALFLGGCTQWHYNLGESLPPEAAALASAPVTDLSASDILSRLGPPLRMSAIPGGYVLGWESWQVTENVLGFSLGALGVDFLSIDVGRASTRNEALLLTFSGQHRLVGGSWHGRDDSVGGGRSVQPLVGLVPVVDVDDITARLPHHDWGRGALEPLPIGLNRVQRPDMGQGGVAQRATPTGTGQQTLELR